MLADNGCLSVNMVTGWFGCRQTASRRFAPALDGCALAVFRVHLGGFEPAWLAERRQMKKREAGSLPLS